MLKWRIQTENGDAYASDVKKQAEGADSSRDSIALVNKAASEANQKLNFIQNKELKIPPSNGIFAVFTNTASKLAHLFPPPDRLRDPSLRLPPFGCQRFPPIYKIATLDLCNGQARAEIVEGLISPLCLHYPPQFVYASAANATLASNEDILIASELYTPNGQDFMELLYRGLAVEYRVLTPTTLGERITSFSGWKRSLAVSRLKFNRSTLRRLLDSMPEDTLIKLHPKDVQTMPNSETVTWAKRMSPMFQHRKNRLLLV
ncbi:hypothetical protein PCASD_10491 [Puccinia coronata f. sp. avenae]|uniref:Uncharacterized protein n=1 Tax=Puccinia coronata f. sp. avenae TaxID=200324 RepID=A0A2N5TFK3_9BASI|nr:hypothetical protein PCASD_10491 [Puccinia coronata f. sp. avenae]